MAKQKKQTIIQDNEIEDLGFEELSEEEIAHIEKITEDAEKYIEENQLCSCSNCKSKREETNINFRWSKTELERCKRVAAKKGLKYQTYIKSTLKQALDKDDAA